MLFHSPHFRLMYMFVCLLCIHTPTRSQAKALFSAQGALEPLIYTGVPEVDAHNRLKAFDSLDIADVHPITHLNMLLASIPVPFDGSGGLRIMGQ